MKGKIYIIAAIAGQAIEVQIIITRGGKPANNQILLSLVIDGKSRRGVFTGNNRAEIDSQVIGWAATVGYNHIRLRYRRG